MWAGMTGPPGRNMVRAARTVTAAAEDHVVGTAAATALAMVKSRKARVMATNHRPGRPSPMPPGMAGRLGMASTSRTTSRA